MTEKIELLGLSKTELAGQVAALGESRFVPNNFGNGCTITA